MGKIDIRTILGKTATQIIPVRIDSQITHGKINNSRQYSYKPSYSSQEQIGNRFRQNELKRIQQTKRSNSPEPMEVDTISRTRQNEETNETLFFYKLALENYDNKIILIFILFEKNGLL